MIVNVEKSNVNNKFYIRIEDFVFDHEIADLLKLSCNKYKNYLINNFGASLSKISREIFFESEKEAEKALEWISALLVLSLLEG